jgi:acylphosphatase
MQRYTIHFTGRVQGVGFRYTTQRIARRYAVAGYVQNLPDGRVLLVAEGDRRTLDRFVAELRQAMEPSIQNAAIARDHATGEFGTPAAGALAIRF